GLTSAGVEQPRAPLEVVVADKVDQNQICTDYQQAYRASQQLLQKALAPNARASFPDTVGHDIMITTSRPCEFSLSGYVDTTNTFKAKVRTYYQMSVEYLPQGSRWVLKELRM